MLSMTWEQIMDLIGGIKHMENSLGGRKPDQGKEKSVQKNIRADAAEEKNAPADANNSATDCDTRLGQKVDTTA